ncbi:MAG TPA: copper resistance protein B [Candidatus Binataceae bacterium]|nr:copper resistance protein B [Candidatus Binataceae bacterium]
MNGLARLLGAAGLILYVGAAARAKADSIPATGLAAGGPVYGQPGPALPMPPAAPSPKDLSPEAAPYGPPVMDDMILGHVLFDQMEGRTNGPDNELRWDGEGWVGTDMNRLWLKSEGFIAHGLATDGDQEALYDRPITTYFDAQAGVRYDLDSNPGRVWGAIGIEGLAPYFFQFAPTFYFSDRGYFAGRIAGSYDLLITNRLILQPQVEMNFYSKSQADRGVGSGLSEIDTGLRLRYEITRKFAPYIGFAYTGTYGETASFTRQEGGNVNDPRFVFGARIWY